MRLSTIVSIRNFSEEADIPVLRIEPLEFSHSLVIELLPQVKYKWWQIIRRYKQHKRYESFKQQISMFKPAHVEVIFIQLRGR